MSIRDILAAAARTARAAAGVQIVYRRDGQTCDAPLMATIGRTSRQNYEADGLVSRVEARDYLFAPEDCTLAGEQLEPAAGDQIDEVQGDVTFTYEVRPLGQEPCWRWSDPHRVTRRVHTILIATQVQSSSSSSGA